MPNALPFFGELEIRVLRLVWQQSCTEPKIAGERMTIPVATSRRSRRHSRLSCRALSMSDHQLHDKNRESCKSLNCNYLGPLRASRIEVSRKELKPTTVVGSLY